MKNYFTNLVRRYGRSKKYKLTYKPKIKSINVWYDGLLMIPKEDYEYDKKVNQIVFSFLPQNKSKVIVEGVIK